MNYNEPNSREGYWKRYFDDERRKKIIYQRPEPLIRKTDTVEQRVISALRKEINMYKKMLCDEQAVREELLANLSREKEETRKYKFQLEKIKKCL
tara:strand:+ start:1501 stop:1785 length:285 start_codon:yes stop_codon:yes gene_type:complete